MCLEDRRLDGAAWDVLNVHSMLGVRENQMRRRIMNAASALFLEKGYKGTSIAAIAGQVGVTRGALYWHFDSKADIFAAVLEGNFAEFFERMRRTVTATEPDARLHQLIRTHVLSQLEAHHPQGPAATTFTISQLITVLAPAKQRQIRRMERDYLEMVEQILRDGIETGAFEIDHVRTTAFSLINLAEYVIIWFRQNGELSVSEVAHLHAVLALRLVGADVPTALRNVELADAEPQSVTAPTFHRADTPVLL